MRKVVMLLALSALVILSVSAISFSQTPAAVDSTYRGDINEDDKVNIFDLLGLLKVLSDPAEQPERAQQIADMDENGSMNIFDLLGLLKVLSGAETPGIIYWGPAPGDTTVIQGITMVFIPGGSFQMGSETGDSNDGPVHTVTLSAFEMSRYEITQAQYNTIVGRNPSTFTGDDNRPVESIYWSNAVTFCKKLSEASGLESCYVTSVELDFTKNGFRLPTEAEWEYACRAGTTTKFHAGDDESDLDRAGWYLSNSGDTTHPVGQKEPNDFGLYDMHGNVAEWCNDWWTYYYTSESQTNPTGPEYGVLRVVRGSSYRFDAVACRSVNRSYGKPDTKYRGIGFRVVRRGSVLQNLSN